MDCAVDVLAVRWDPVPKGVNNTFTKSPSLHHGGHGEMQWTVVAKGHKGRADEKCIWAHAIGVGLVLLVLQYRSSIRHRYCVTFHHLQSKLSESIRNPTAPCLSAR